MTGVTPIAKRTIARKTTSNLPMKTDVNIDARHSADFFSALEQAGGVTLPDAQRNHILSIIRMAGTVTWTQSKPDKRKILTIARQIQALHSTLSGQADRDGKGARVLNKRTGTVVAIEFEMLATFSDRVEDRDAFLRQLALLSVNLEKLTQAKTPRGPTDHNRYMLVRTLGYIYVKVGGTITAARNKKLPSNEFKHPGTSNSFTGSRFINFCHLIFCQVSDQRRREKLLKGLAAFVSLHKVKLRGDVLGFLQNSH
jgi:hypothetical protein